jgi:hypothetical protein
MASEIKVNKITGKGATGGTDAPLQFNGNVLTATITAGTIGSAVTGIPAAGITGILGSEVTIGSTVTGGTIDITSSIIADNGWTLAYNKAYIILNSIVVFAGRFTKVSPSAGNIGFISNSSYRPNSTIGTNSISYQGEYVDRIRVNTDGYMVAENLGTAGDTTFRIDMNMWWPV